MNFNFFKSKVSHQFDFSVLNTDMHSHLVPAVDDGSDSIQASLELIEGLLALGYKKIITTPHVRPDYFPNTKENILAGFQKIELAVREAGLPVELACAAEYFVDYDFPGTMEQGDLLTFSGQHVLIEISTFSAPPNLFETIFQLRVKGYKPVLAHPERYVYFQNLSDFHKLKEFGCLFQVNILSLAGHYGRAVKELANKLIKEKLVDLLGTDLHHLRHLQGLKQVTTEKKIMSLLNTYSFQNPAF